MHHTTNPILAILLLILCSFTVVSEDLKLKKTKSGDYEERYFVYKEQPLIRQDQYVKMFLNMFGIPKVVEVGTYNQNQKTGMWMDFYHLHNTNMIRSFGEYVQGKKEGEWSFFFKHEEPFNPFNPSLQRSGKINQTNLEVPKSKKEICVVTIDTTNVRLMEIGQYKNDQKIGVWEYYSPDGKLRHKYDHSRGKLVESYETSLNHVVYLGGFDRFFSYWNLVLNPQIIKQLSDTCRLDFIVDENGFKLVECVGDSLLIGEITNIVSMVPSDWVLLFEEERNSLHYIFQFVKNPENGFVKYNGRFRYGDHDATNDLESEPDLLISPYN